MAKKKITFEYTNGMVVGFKKNLSHHPSTDHGQLQIDNFIGISFSTSRDNIEPGYYVHVEFINRNNRFEGWRFKLEDLKKINTPIVSLRLKKHMLRMLNNYHKRKYIDNLRYLEALGNINKIKTK